MKLLSKNLVVERAQPWLGTVVRIRVEGLPVAAAHLAIDAAFEEVAAVHRLMSFHERGSDVTRLNVHGDTMPLSVHPWTLDVLAWALRFSRLSDGCFDISVGAELVDWRFLPAPPGAVRRPRGSWRDIELRPDGKVLFHRPLWIDLGGIAKGYAVDRASECLRRRGASCNVVNAGGDIRVRGRRAELVALNIGPGTPSFRDAVPMIQLSNGSIASSSGRHQWCRRQGSTCAPHFDGVRRRPAPTGRFVSVIAEQCTVADALTKIVMVEGANSANLLRKFGGSAHVHDPTNAWLHLGAEVDVA